MICGITRRDGINNEIIREMSGMEKIKQFLREHRGCNGLGIWKGWMMKEPYSEQGKKIL